MLLFKVTRFIFDTVFLFLDTAERNVFIQITDFRQRNRHIVNPFHLGEALADDGDEILMLLLQLVQLVVRRDGLVDDQPFDQTADVQIQTDLDVACNPQAQLGFNRPDDRFDVAENDFRVENRQIVQQIFHREVPQQVVVKLLDFVRTHEFVKQLGDLLDVLLFDPLAAILERDDQVTGMGIDGSSLFYTYY